MKSLVITVAGMSSRFNRDTKEPVLKCLYYEGSPEKALLSLQINRLYGLVDEIVVVGGYRFDDLKQFIDRKLSDEDGKIKLVYNDHFSDYGSGFSLRKGIDNVSERADEIVFIEGDLFFDTDSVTALLTGGKDAISINNEPIRSDKAVALYFDTENHPHYLYDTNHSYLEIHEPFTAIYNSGQIWKFKQPSRVKEICRSLSPAQERGTNLEIIQQYFGACRESQLDIIRIRLWYNCNTVADYREAIKSLNL